MDTATKINLELDGAKAYKWADGEPFELEDNDPVTGDTLNALVDDLKEHLGRDLRDIVKRLMRLEERVDAIK